MSLMLLNGRTVNIEELRALAVINYGHFTSMQVRSRGVRGLDLHVARLQAGTRELFDADLSRERILETLADAAERGPMDASLRLTVFARDFDYRMPLHPVIPDLLMTLGPPSPSDKPPLRVKSYAFVRPLPHIKHVGTFPLFHLRRQALKDGFDDALLVAPEGQVTEGSIWNLGFWDGEGVVWPEGPALRGTGEHLLQAGLDNLGVKQTRRRIGLDEVGAFRAAFATNASGLQAVSAIDDVTYGEHSEVLSRLRAAMDTQIWSPLA